jgi:hypothetical protein
VMGTRAPFVGTAAETRPSAPVETVVSAP